MAEIPEYPETDMRARLLVVDHEPAELAALSTLLRLIGYRVDEATSVQKALMLLESVPCHLLLLDPYSPGVDGGDLILRAREMQPHLPIIVLTAHPSIDSAIAAVKAGAADYLLEPFSIEDLCAAISQALREHAEESNRQQLLSLIEGTLRTLQQADSPAGIAPSPSPSPTTSERFVHAGLITLDRQKRRAVVNSVPHRTAELTEGEAAVLTALMERTDQVLSCKQLARAAMGYDLYEKQAQSVVRPYIFRLRRKIESSPDSPHLIRTVRGRGYFLSVASAA
jgi:DNA-binding response OmpR family regulator